MKAVILAGGLGTRLSEETDLKPKPMVQIGDRPILWHIMKCYSHYGINDFIICLGYKGYIIKEYFLNYYMHHSNVTFDFQSNKTTIHNSFSEPWTVTLVDTGQETMTGGRLKRIQPFIGNETFCFTYGDGVSDVDIAKLTEFHKEKVKTGTIATLTAVLPKGRYGSLELSGDKVDMFMEKPQFETSYINGGFFVLEPEVFDYIDGDMISWESDPINQIAAEGKLSAFKHFGFWQPMDTLREKNLLNQLWEKGSTPWKKWD